MIIQGKNGTRKSSLINCIFNALSSAAMGGRSPSLFLAPTGISDFNIHGKTIHSALKIPIKYMKPLSEQGLEMFQEKMRRIRYVLIDEMSFIGLRLFVR